VVRAYENNLTTAAAARRAARTRNDDQPQAILVQEVRFAARSNASDSPVWFLKRLGTLPSWGSTPGLTAKRRSTAKEVVEMPNSIKDEVLYKDLRKQGNSKEKAARISNAAAAKGRSSIGRKGGRSGAYEGWTVTELKKRARELGISGYSDKSKDQLVTLLRNH
jgi:hypothetical protein